MIKGKRKSFQLVRDEPRAINLTSTLYRLINHSPFNKSNSYQVNSCANKVTSTLAIKLKKNFLLKTSWKPVLFMSMYILLLPSMVTCISDDHQLPPEHRSYDSDADRDSEGILGGLLQNLKEKFADSSECGYNRYNNDSPLTERIVGGNTSMPGEWPWQVSLRLTHPQAGKVGHWCGGVLVDRQWVMTAAHCILNPVFSLPQAMFWEVRVGEHNQKLTEASERTYTVSRVFHYPWYRGYDNDLALMKLTQPVEVSDYVSPICLPDDQDIDFSNKQCVATGWGKVDYNKRGSDILQKVQIEVYDNSECHRAYFPKFKIGIRQWHLCAGTKIGGKGTCHGDSGGPLQCKVGNKWMLAGITSFGSGCAKPGFPDVYTRVAHFLNWINQLRSFY